jgi:hypothetical protein
MLVVFVKKNIEAHVIANRPLLPIYGFSLLVSA